MRRVLANLLDNAAKFTRDGVIMLEFDVNETGARFLVQDTGIGLPAGRTEVLFDSFTQADASTTRRYGGTGLGLYISRELCELNRATLVYQPREGGGSIFRIAFADPERWGAVEDE